MKVYIHSGEMLSCHGSLEATWSALLAGLTPLSSLPKNHIKNYPLAFITDLGEELGRTTRLEAMLEKVYTTLPVLPAKTALVCATTKAAIDELFTEDFPAQGQVYHMASAIEKRLGLGGDVTTVSAACASGTIAIARAARKIVSGECDHALVLGCDLMSDFVISGFASLKALSPTTCKPFDRRRDGLSLGEGCGWLLLTKEPSTFNATGRSFSLSRWGISCDATHITAPCRKASGLLRTLHQTTAGSTILPGGINGHGTGTSYNDAMELLAFNTTWPAPPPVCSIKGSIGHCLGAAGVIESLISLKSLEEGFLPPTTGLDDPEENGAAFLSGNSRLPLLNPTILSCNSGFGGINAALLFEDGNPL